MRRLTAGDGVLLAYRSYPAEGEVRGTVVYLHGIQSHGAWYLETASELARRGYSVYLPDRRGSGRSGGPRGHFPSTARLVDDVRRVVELARHEDGDAPLFVVGGCWGARTAIGHALEDQKALAGLALVCPALFAKVDVPPADKLRVLAGGLVGSMHPIRVPLADELFTDNAPYLEFIKGDALSLREVTASFFFRQAVWDRELREATSLQLPVLVLQSGDDPIVDAARVREWFERLESQNKRYVLYPGWGHLIDFEDERQRYWDDLAGWLDSVAAS
ncbi:MAG TPA: alpha/beta fold hydrolase [Gaiellaceae bacterium]|nr:alpha/beta fold hydrolase [Gaiellaceae bacterium]